MNIIEFIGLKKKKIGMSGWQKHWMGAHLIIPGIVSLSYLPAATSLLLHSTSQSQRKKWPLLSERKAFWVHGLQLVLMHLGLSTLNTHPEGANHFSVLHTRSRFKGGKKKKQTHTHSHTHSHMQKKNPQELTYILGGPVVPPSSCEVSRICHRRQSWSVSPEEQPQRVAFSLNPGHCQHPVMGELALSP